ncbi:S1C family serine protease [Wukongibacter baidiensis]
MKKKNIVLMLFIVFSLLLTTLSFANNDGQVKVLINGTQINEGYKVIDNNVYVSLNSIEETSNGRYEWNESTKTVSLTTDRDKLVSEVIKEISPSVVGIIGSLKANHDISYRNDYFDEIAHGTGMVIKSNGEILTNAHVVKNMDKIVVVLSDGSGYEGKVKSIDEESDLAVVKIEKNNLKPVKFGKEEDLVIGNTVIAIGTPISFSLRNSASVGIISGVNRSLHSSYRLIQTDAAINPGNSGGPLVNLKGEVIGVNSSKYMGTGIEGMGFSIPINTVKYVVNQFDKYGAVKKPHLGTEFEEDWAAKVGLPSKGGLRIVKIETNSPAQQSGLKLGDVLLSINNVSINSNVDYNEELKKYNRGESVIIRVRRDGAVKSFKVIFSSKIK